MKVSKIFFLSTLIFGALLFSCSDDDDPCADTTCPEGFVELPIGVDCECVEDEDATGTAGIVEVSGSLEGTTTWTKDNVYVLNGRVVVDDGSKLIIEAGTVIKGEEGTGTIASALIIARGAKIEANGTASEPIIFTSVLDEITSGQIESPNLSVDDNGLWGGLIVLGAAPVSVGSGDTEGQIEGIPADDLFGRYGGDDVADNSGIIRYMSVRHGGTLIGDENEINGITFGGVGNGTVVENIEVVANLDDGVEWFGGTVNVTNVIVTNGEDDGLDIDQNYSGTINNAIVIQSGLTVGDNALELDGPEGSTYVNGSFTINNVTLIDEDGGADTAGDIKSNTIGTINNASWRGYTDNVKIRSSCEESDCSTVKDDSFSNYVSGLVRITNSEWVGQASLEDWTTVYGDGDCAEEAPCNISNEMQLQITDLLAADGNAIVDSPTKGADMSAFTGWTWSEAVGKLN